VAELRRWLTDEPVDHTVRLEPLLRSLFFWQLTPDELAAHLTREGAFYRETARAYREYAAAKDRGDYGDSPQTRSMRITVEGAIRLYDALADWADWAQSADLR
jgi:hypothetical protein